MTAIERFSLQLRTETYRYRTPMKFGGRIVEDVTVLSVDCDAETGAGRGRGLGSMTMGVAWAWPSATLDDPTKLELVLELSQRIAQGYLDNDQTGHPMDLCHRMAGSQLTIAAELAAEKGLAEPIPELAVLLAASPIDAALFDAHGKAAGVSSYALLGRDHLPNDLGHYLDAEFSGLHLSDFISSTPCDSLPLYHLVGALDPLTDADIETPVGDGLPETLGQWIDRNGLTHLKIKLDGANLDWDAQRVARIDAVASQRRDGDWSYSLDFNERCEDEDYVLQLLDRLQRDAAQGLQRVQYIEQPTHRDLERPGQATMHRAAERRPVVIDESLVGLKSLRTAVEQGYSGIALKACKGHSEALLLGAVARHKKLYLCVQDLTCVGASLLHSASLAAHIPGVAAVESNGRQYSPDGNRRWMQRFPDFFEIQGGRIPTAQLAGPGLGYGDDPIH
ncbi:mandelate racemase/muconate lactonizing enzyme family protein [Stieleria sp. TO1_6]|nr:mandelate racemase/muconate lactonizing enzyme family protein [Stieleria tagensis]MCO8121960.1 mandelate racemase/muconate lactonizing enzyme family protein [Stieleria tagensis]